MRVIGRFFLWLFAVVGFFIIVVATSLTTWFVLSSEETESLPSRMVLSLDLNAGVSEAPSRSPFSILSPDKSTSLREIVAGLRKAETDDRVAGIVMRMGSSGVGITRAQEIRDAVARVRKAGKFAVAYADSFSAMPGATSEYFLASGFDEIWMQPSGELMTTGIVIEVPFVADALEKIGVEARMEQRKEFKSAPETFTRESMSAPARANLQDLVNSWFGQVTGGIADGRSIDAAAARDAIDSSPLLSGDAVARKLVDKLGYWPDVMKAVRKRGGADAELVTYASYVGEGDLPFTSGPTVALVYGSGPIVSGDVSRSPLEDDDVFAAASVARSIAAAAKDPDVKAIILRIDSPGGSYLASDTVWNAVREARAAGKPVVASLASIAASGGYFVAMGADRIVASPGTVTGSIGVYGGKFDTAGLWPKLGVAWDTVKAGRNATMWSPFRDFTADGKARLDAMMDAVYDDFTAKLAKGRDLSAGQVDTVAGGRVWTGEAASKVGLVDRLGGLAAAIAAAKEVADIAPEDDVTLTQFPTPRTPFERLLSLMADEGGGMSAWLVETLGLAPYFDRMVAQRFGPLLDEVDALRPPAGRLQMPPMRVRH